MPDPFRHSLDSAERDARVRSVLARLQLADTAQQRVRELSGGQQRRLAIAVELLTDPPLLMLDEPTSFCAAAAVVILPGTLPRAR